MCLSARDNQTSLQRSKHSPQPVSYFDGPLWQDASVGSAFVNLKEQPDEDRACCSPSGSVQPEHSSVTGGAALVTDTTPYASSQGDGESDIQPVGVQQSDIEAVDDQQCCTKYCMNFFHWANLLSLIILIMVSPILTVT